MLEGLLEGLGEVICRLLWPATGHGLLWLITGGRWKFGNGHDAVASIVGFGFWIGMILGVGWLLS